MSTAATLLEPLLSEGDTQEDDTAHDAWIRAELAHRAANPGKLIPHDEVMATARALIEEIKARHECA